MLSKCIRSGRQIKKKKQSEVKLFLSHGKLKCKGAFNHIQYQTRCVYQDNLLSELHNSCSCLQERSKISTATQKRQNSMLSAFLKIHSRQECASPLHMVARVTLLHMAGDYCLQHKYFIIKLCVSSNVTT